ncbi:hypothetical protein [Streptomyces vinaceus]|uniref:hypothetical protein n=1 Tax=Streptomyces vinaceus TaxID=1960 RepID=UPI0036909945
MSVKTFTPFMINAFAADLRQEAEKFRVLAGESYKYAIEADRDGDHDRAERLRARAVWQTRNAELAERLIGRDELRGGKLRLVSLGVEEAHQLLDRFDSHPIVDAVSDADAHEHTRATLAYVQEKACDWAFGTAARAEALKEIVRLIAGLESQGVEVNLAAMARSIGISRQTLHARLREAKDSEGGVE